MSDNAHSSAADGPQVLDRDGFDKDARARFNEARRQVNVEWERRTSVKHGGGYFCFGVVDSWCGHTHELGRYAVDRLTRFRINKGGGRSDRRMFSGKTGKQYCPEVWIPGHFHADGAAP